MRLFAFVVLLFLGCSYKSTTISLPQAKHDATNVAITSAPFEGYILVKEKKFPIKLSGSFAKYLEDLLLRCKKPLQHYTVDIQISKLQALYWVGRSKIFVKVKLFVKLEQKGVLKQKSIEVVRVANVTRFTFRKKLQIMLKDAAKEAVGIIEEML